MHFFVFLEFLGDLIPSKVPGLDSICISDIDVFFFAFLFFFIRLVSGSK